jgi:phosphoribosyl 1,2-cyclic phosphate phosphodiesterase
MMTVPTFLFLGTGGSMGVPVIGCDCSVCTSDSPYNKRFRSSGLLTVGNKKILIDSGPDFRAQALRIDLKKLDGVIITHAHHDHTAGIDELRTLCMHSKESLPCLFSSETYEHLKKRFYYIFDTNPSPSKILITKLQPQVFDRLRGDVDFAGIKWRYFTYEQCGMPVIGLRVGDFAYVSDIFHYPETIFEDLAGIKTLVVSALRFTPSPVHFSVDQAIDFSRRAGAKKTWLTHIAHELDHEKTNCYLPENVRMAYDGLKIEIMV